MRVNQRYLPDAPFPDPLQIADSIEAAMHGVGDVIIAVPSNAFRALLAELAPRTTREVRVAWATKGFEHHSGLLPNQVARQVLGVDYTMAVLSGPTFAREVGRGLPTAMVVASADAAFAMRIAEDLASPGFRTYVSTDIAGVEIGGAVKNVIAVGVGLSDGLGFGANMRVALITRGLAEMTAARRRPGCARAHLHGTRRTRRSGAHLHRRPIAQPPLRPRAGARPHRGRGHAGDRPGGRGLLRRTRAAWEWRRD